MSKKGNKDTFLQAMLKTFGNITKSCEIVGIDRSLPYKWELEDEDFKEAFRANAWRETRLDMIEGKLDELAEEKNPTVLIFMAKTLGKARGYIEKQEIDTNIKYIPEITLKYGKG